LERHRWLVFVLPLAVYMLGGSLEPTPKQPGGAMLGLALPYSSYPLLYTLKIVLTLAAILLVCPGYRQFPWRFHPWVVLLGVAGAGLWIGLCHLHLEQKLLEPLGMGRLVDLAARPGYNPLHELHDQPAWALAFLIVRFFGLAAVVPLIEEFFLRGFVMRFVMAAEWWKVPFGQVSAAAVAAGILVPVLTHPGEMIAAAAWFGLVTWLMARTRNIWDCVGVHAITNLSLGIYVVISGDWALM
jgi:CAAX prenyl protease-like protein